MPSLLLSRWSPEEKISNDIRKDDTKPIDNLLKQPTGNDLDLAGRVGAAVGGGDDVVLVVDHAAAEVAAELVLEGDLVRELVRLGRLAPDQSRAPVDHEPVALVHGPPPLGGG